MNMRTTHANSLKSTLIGLTLGFIAIRLIIELYFVNSQPIVELVKWRSIDDTFYYLNVAWNFANGNGVTFDQINPTNGIQSLWFLIESCMALFAETKDALFRSVLNLQAILLFLTSLLLLTILPRYLDLFTSLAFTLYLSYVSYYFIFSIGIESALNLLGIVVCSLLLLSYISTRSTKTLAWLSVSCGILFLIRVDNLIWICGIAIGLLIHLVKTKEVKKIIFLLLPMMTISCCYIAYQFVFWGNVMPVSGVAKRVLETNLILRNELSGLTLVRHYFFSVKSSTVALLRIFLLRKELVIIFLWFILTKGFSLKCFTNLKLKKFRPNFKTLTFESILFLVIGSFTLLHFLMDKLMFSFRGETFMWHNIGEGCLLVFIVFVVADKFLNEKSWRDITKSDVIVFSLLVLVVLGLSVQASMLQYEREKDMKRMGFDPQLYEARYKIAYQIRDMTEEGDVLASWNAGQLGYFSDRRVINLDGVINSYDYIRMLELKTVISYLKDKEVDYIIDYDIDRYWGYFFDENLKYDVVREFVEESTIERLLKLVRLHFEEDQKVIQLNKECSDD